MRLNTIRFRDVFRYCLLSLRMALVFVLSFACFAWAGGSTEKLPPQAFVSATAYPLVGAKTVWVDPSGMRNNGARDPLDYAYITNPSRSELVDWNSPKMVKADRYGSVGLNGNLGSARAGILGSVMIKGLGTTPLLGKFADAIHGTGVLPITQALKEVVSSRLLSKELPYSANVAFAVIDTGDTVTTRFGTTEPRGLVLRRSPLRPAHFMLNPHTPEEDKEAERERLATMRPLLRELWAAELGLPKNATLSDAILEFSRRLGRQYGYAFAHRIHHGGATPSNIELSGAFLDLVTVTTVDGYQKLMGWDLLPHGDPDLPVQYIIRPLVRELRKNGFASQLPSDSTVRETVVRAFEHSFDLEMLRHVGLATAHAEDYLAKLEGRDLIYNIRKLVATHRQGENLPSKTEVPMRSENQIDVNGILTDLAGTTNLDSALRKLELRIPDVSLRSSFAEAYVNLSRSYLNGFPRSSKFEARTRMVRQAQVLNRRRPELMRSLSDFTFKGATQMAGSGARIQKQIDDLIKRNSQVIDGEFASCEEEMVATSL